MSELIVKLPNIEGIILFILFLFFAYHYYHWYTAYQLKYRRDVFLNNYCKGILIGTYIGGALSTFLVSQYDTSLNPFRLKRFYPVNFQDLRPTTNSNRNSKK